MKIKAAVVHSGREPFRIEEVELLAPKEGEVRVRIVACGVCHTDETARNEFYPVPLPAVFGHEGCGVVEELGPGVTEFKPGDRVAFSFGSCGVCQSCRSGKPYGCREFVRLNLAGERMDGTPRLMQGVSRVSSFFYQSAFATHAIVHVNNTVPVPDDVELKLCGVLGCGIQTGAGAVLNYLKPDPASTIIVTGCGPVGMAALMAARIAGCTKIIACDVNPSRLELAVKEFGATHAINSRETEDVPAAVREITGSEGTTYAIDTTGIGAIVRQSLNCVEPQGKCVILGATRELTIDVETDLMSRGRTLVGIIEGNSNPKIFIPQLLEYYRAGMFPFDKLLSYYDFEQINEAFDDMKKGTSLKAVLVMDKDTF